jgi:hypothetical protein
VTAVGAGNYRYRLRSFTFAHRRYLIEKAYNAAMIASLAARDSSNSFPPSVEVRS